MSSINRWHLSDDVKEKYILILKDYFAKLESLSAEEVANMENEEFQLDLYNSGLAPYTLQHLLEEEFGYKRSYQDSNGWEMDLWIYLTRTDGKTFPSFCEEMVISSCGQTFELTLTPSEMD